MANEDFSSKQIQTLETIVRRVVDERLKDERVHTKQMLEAQSLEDRKYLVQFFRKELAELRQMVAKLDTREDNDAKSSVEEWSEVNKRLTVLEEQFAKFSTAHA